MAKRSTELCVEVAKVLGLDLGDRWGRYGVLDLASGEREEEGRVAMTRRALVGRFGKGPRLRVVVEVGTHSPWVSRLLAELGHEVWVANARRVRLITASVRKSDQVDAWMLARLGRVDVGLLSPVEHRSAKAQAALAVVRSRDAVVRSRTLLINQVRGTVKAMGERLPGWSSASFARRSAEALPEELRPALEPVVSAIAELTAKIKAYDQQIRWMIETKYPQAGVLLQVPGVGPITALTFVLTVERVERFAKSRTVGAYVGLVPRRDQSGQRDPQLGITKHGDPHLRRLLVQCAHYILGHHGPDSDLRRYGQRIAARGGKTAKKRAVVAVARKLAVLLHRLWVTGAVYEPLYQSQRAAAQAQAQAA